jgi:3-hydroxybutyryl-CoA dehydrogenase
MKEIAGVGIVGAGTMGRRIALSCVVWGKGTRLFDIEPRKAAEADRVIRSFLEKWVADGRLDRAKAESSLLLLSFSQSLRDCVSGVDLVIECVPENVGLKRGVFADIDRYAGPETLIGTNTSSIPGSKLADATGRPEKVFNFNFGPPEDRKVEVMGHPGTAPDTIDAALRFVREIGLVPILVRKEIMGYAGNRVWRAIKKEVLFLLDGGYATAEDIDRGWMLEWGTPIGPCGLMDKIGLDVVRDIELIYYGASQDPSDRPPRLLLDMVEQGKLGVKSGEGFYRYPHPAYERSGWLEGR